jgi:ATP-binding cassette, subfamily F, member 3
MAEFLTITNLTKTLGDRVILDNASTTLSTDQRIGVIGRNGAGKTTFFRLVLGIDQPDSGKLVHSNGLYIGYLEQHDTFRDDESCLDWLVRTTGHEDWECAKAATSFQLDEARLAMTPRSLSGGYQMRVKLTAMVVKQPNFLFLDEPSNYLDLSTLLLLERYLLSFDGGYLIISHDRAFLTRCCDHTLEIQTGKLTMYPGRLADYFAYKQEQVLQAESFNKGVERKQVQLQKFVDRFRATASKAAAAQSKLKQLEKLEKIDIEGPLATAKIRFPAMPIKKGPALDLTGLVVGYPDKKIAGPVDVHITRGQRFAVLGDNGQGKTTFMKTLAGELPELSGNLKWGHETQIGYFAQHVYEDLDSDMSIYDYLERVADPTTSKQQIMDTAGSLLFSGDDAKKPLSVLSGGEKARVLLAELILSKSTVLLLDEPTNHLDFETVELLAQGLNEYTGTVIFISHDRTFIQAVATGILHVSEGNIRPFPGPFHEFLSYLEDQFGEVLVSKPEKAKSGKPSNPKNLAKQLAAIEKKLAKAEKEKQEILAYFEANPSDYDPEKHTRLAEVEKTISELEDTWATVSMG